jgi:thiosulfate/3-mercaptopyruvate sulfurtransferase
LARQLQNKAQAVLPDLFSAHLFARFPMSISAVLISPDQLNALQSTEPVVVIDTRDADAFAAGHIPGAVNLREVFTFLATSTPEGLQELKKTFATALGAAGLSGAETAVFYEDAMNSGYGQSCRGYYLLSWLGYPKIKVLNGGFSAWTAAGLPVSTEAATPTPATFPELPMTDVMLTQADVQAALGTDTVLLDVRDVDEWIGDSSSPYGKDFAPRKGRLPGAVWIEWYRFMKPSAQGPVFKTPDEVRAECATAGVSPSDTVYLYCFKGARASNTFLALKQAGFSDVRMYFGSWNEWSRDDSLPIETGLPVAAKPATQPALALAA